MTAYWLVYVSDNDAKGALKTANLFNYDAAEKNRATKELAVNHTYGAMLDQELLTYTDTENKKVIQAYQE
jgi:hypothetical protein